MVATIRRDGREVQQTFKKGKAAGGLEKLGAAKGQRMPWSAGALHAVLGALGLALLVLIILILFYKGLMFSQAVSAYSAHE